MKRAILVIVLTVVVLATVPTLASAFAPQPEPPKCWKTNDWTPPGAMAGFPHIAAGADWTPPGLIRSFAPQPEPPRWTPIMQVVY